MTEGGSGWYLADVRCPIGHKVGEVYADGDDLTLTGTRLRRGLGAGGGAEALTGEGGFEFVCVTCGRSYPGDRAQARAAVTARRYYVLRRSR